MEPNLPPLIVLALGCGLFLGGACSFVVFFAYTQRWQNAVLEIGRAKRRAKRRRRKEKKRVKAAVCERQGAGDGRADR